VALLRQLWQLLLIWLNFGSGTVSVPTTETEHKAETKKRAIPRKAAGQSWEDPTLAEWPENDYRFFCGNLGNEVNDDLLSKAFARFPTFNMAKSWEDPTLAEWPENDYRLFCGDLGNEVNDDVLSKAFARFPTFNMAKVIRDKRTGKTKGYGFVSFLDPADLAAALKEMNGKYVGNRPIKLRKSSWKERTDQEAAERQKGSFFSSQQQETKDGEEEERTPQVINPWYSEGRDVQLSCSLEVAGPRPKQ
uniref:RRM domain-containing protein n=1 Tax=Brassica oleracea var. oleracea TaxID=109376 RepID=A0A0D3BD18_BRAOL